MARLSREHRRLLGNGCTRPPELDCAFESICGNCTFSQTSSEFRPTLQAQHAAAANKGQRHRADLLQRPLKDLNKAQSIMIYLTRIPRIMPLTGGIALDTRGLRLKHGDRVAAYLLLGRFAMSTASASRGEIRLQDVSDATLGLDCTMKNRGLNVVWSPPGSSLSSRNRTTVAGPRPSI
jgi:hypothetical protein